MHAPDHGFIPHCHIKKKKRREIGRSVRRASSQQSDAMYGALDLVLGSRAEITGSGVTLCFLSEMVIEMRRNYYGSEWEELFEKLRVQCDILLSKGGNISRKRK